MTNIEEGIRNPRRDSKDNFGRNLWYPYYAGYSPRFAEDIVLNSNLRPNAVVADPWNGSGTTTWAAGFHGVDNWGGDLNPVMKVVAKARLLSAENCQAVAALAEKIVSSARVRESRVKKPDPLDHWFLPTTVSSMRSIERSIRRHVIPMEYRADSGLDIASHSEISSFLYLCLFLLARKSAAQRVSSNPTWIKNTGQGSIEIDLKSLGESFVETAKSLAVDAGEAVQDMPLRMAKSTIDVASSLELPLGNSSVDLVLTSPPYCTRLDYAVATSLELAVLGGQPAYANALRRRLMGTTTVPKIADQPKAEWGTFCLDFLKEVKNHPSQASSVYYYKSHLQYFSDLSTSIREISRVVRSDGRVVMVVQDSQYKEIRNDLAQIVCEMAENVGLQLKRRSDFGKRLSLRSLHPGRSNYKSICGPTESVLVLAPTSTTRS